MSMAASAENATGDIGLTSHLESELEKKIDAFLSGAKDSIGTWTLAWGPAVKQIDLVVANAMFAAKGSDGAGNDVYVVAVAATNVNSLYDIFTEDAAQGRPDITLTAWPYALPAGTATPNVTLGTLDGVGYLLAMTDSGGQTLQAFLGGIKDPSKATLIFTGHSLGGALSPALALALFAETLDTSDWGAVYLYPTAAPTVGDANYATLWNSVFPVASDSSGETWNQIVWNTLDVVPQAWALLGNLNTLYPSSDIPCPSGSCLANVLAGVQALAAAAGGTFVQPNNTTLTGTFSPWTGATSSSPMVTYFLIEVLYQHTYAYFGLLGVSGLLQFFPVVTDPTASAAAPTAIQLLCTTVVGDYCYESQRGSACGSTSAGSGSGSQDRMPARNVSGAVSA
jgi:hypothetical protein